MKAREPLPDRLLPVEVRQAPATGSDNGCKGITLIYEPIRDQMVRFEMQLEAVIDESPSDLTVELRHALKGGGKRLRPALVLLAGSLYPGRAEPLISMALGYEMLHTATLVHDDTIDGAITRRGMFTVNRLWGNSNAVLLGDYLCGCSALMAARTENLRAMGLFWRALADICGGAIEEHVAGSKKGREEYFATISRKTASLFSATTESGAALSKAPEKAVRALKTYGHNLGMAFQTVDDIHDVVSDISQGSITLPSILLLEQAQNRWVSDVLDRDPQTGLGILAEMVDDSCVLDDCYRIADAFCAQAWSALDVLPRGPIRNSLCDLLDYVVHPKV